MCWNKKKTNNEKPYQDSTNNRPVNYIFISVMVVICFIVGCSIWMFFEECRYEAKHAKWYDELIKKQETAYSAIVPTDSVLSAIIADYNLKRKDTKASSQTTKENVEKYLIPLSDVLKIKESQKQLLMRQDQLIDDMRQETNNIINKMNAWLGFWMGVMAILGVFVPIALQLNLYKENRNDAEKLNKEFNGMSDRYKKEYEKVQETLQKEISTKLLESENKIGKHFVEIQNNYKQDIDNMRFVQFTAITRCFHNIIDSPEIRTNEFRDQLLLQNWSEIVAKLGEFIVCYDKQTKDDVNSYVMSAMLLQVSSVLTSFKILIPRRMRQIDSLSNESYNIIKALNTVPLDKSSIINKLNNYKESLSNFHPI